jgi:hypothetical protein
MMKSDRVERGMETPSCFQKPRRSAVLAPPAPRFEHSDPEVSQFAEEFAFSDAIAALGVAMTRAPDSALLLLFLLESRCLNAARWSEVFSRKGKEKF